MNATLAKKVFLVLATAITTIGLLLQCYIIVHRADTEGTSYWSSAVLTLSYMTIWTNIILCVTFWLILLRKDNGLSPSFQSALLSFILIVGVVYHLLFAHLWQPTGVQLITDKIFHYIAPVLYLIYWALILPKQRLPVYIVLTWLLYPLVYATFTLARGLYTSIYPYPIFDLNKLSISSVALNTTGIFMAYLVTGIVIILVNNVIANRRKA